jgi:hypothetical protein
VEFIMSRRSSIAWVVVFLAMFALAGAALRRGVAQKAAVPKPQDKLVIGEEEVRQLLLLIDTHKSGKISSKSG